MGISKRDIEARLRQMIQSNPELSTVAEQEAPFLFEQSGYNPSSTIQTGNNNIGQSALKRSEIEQRLKKLVANNPELAKIAQEEEPSLMEKPSRFGQFIRGILSGIGSEADVQANFYNTYGDNPALDYGDPLDRPGYRGFLTKELNKESKETAENASESLPEFFGYGEEYEPSSEDTAGKVANFAGKMVAPSSFLPMGGYGNVISSAAKGGWKAASKALSKDIGVMGAQAAAIKGTPRFTEEGGIPGAIEDIIKGAATSKGLSYAGRGASSVRDYIGKKNLKENLNNNVKPISRIEKTVSDYLIDKVGAENVDQVLNNLREYRSSIGYKPLTSEIAENDALAQLYRAQKGIAGSGIDEQQALNANVIKSALEGSKKGSFDISRPQEYIRGKTSKLESDIASAIGEINPRLNDTEAGRILQDTLIKGLKEKESARRIPTTPIYESLSKNLSEITPSNTLDVLNNTTVKGDVKSDFDYIKRQLTPKLSKKDLEYKKYYDKYMDSIKGWGKDAIEKVKSTLEPPKSTIPTVADLSAIRKDVINSMLEKYNRSGEKTRATMVRKVKNALDLDLQSIPEQIEADTMFKKLSGPVSEITENKPLKSATKEIHGTPVMSESRVLGTFINSSAGSVDDSKALFNQIKDNPKAMKTVKDYLHGKAISYIIDPNTGRVDLKKLESFKDKYKGAKILYPDLYNIKLKNLSHAQFAANKFIDKTNAIQKTLERDAFGKLVGGDPKNIMTDIFNKNSTGNMKKILSEISHDKSGNAMNGLRNETIDYFEKSISNRSKVGSHHALSYDKMKKFMDKHQKALDAVLEPHQISVIKEIEKIVGGQNVAATRGLAPGSPTNANIRNALSLSNWSTGAIKASLTKLGFSIPGISEFIKNFADARLAKKEEILNRALRDPEYADLLMSIPLKSKKNAIEFSHKIKQFNQARFNRARYLKPVLMEMIGEGE